MKNYFLNFEKKKIQKKKIWKFFFFKKNFFKENFFFSKNFWFFFEVFQFSGGFRKNGQNRFLKKKLEQILSYSPLLGHCGGGVLIVDSTTFLQLFYIYKTLKNSTSTTLNGKIYNWKILIFFNIFNKI